MRVEICKSVRLGRAGFVRLYNRGTALIAFSAMSRSQVDDEGLTSSSDFWQSIQLVIVRRSTPVVHAVWSPKLERN